MNTMNKTTKVLSLSLVMFAMAGMMGFTTNAYAGGNGNPGTGPGGFNMVLIGTDKDDKDVGDNGNSHAMFIKRNGHTKILLTEGPFKILDRDGTDGKAAFQLPNPNPQCVSEDTTDENLVDCDITFDYWAFIRVLGKPIDSNFEIQTCADELEDINNTDDLTNICSLEKVSLPNANGKNSDKGAKFTNVSKELLTLCIDVADDEGNFDNKCDIRVGLFDDRLTNYTWEVDANGHYLVQLRFVVNTVA